MRHTKPIIIRWIKRSAFWLTLVCMHAQLQGQSASTDFYGRVVNKNALCTQASGFMSEQDVERLIGEMLAMQGLKNRYIVVGCQSVTNCIATVDKSNRPVILFNPSFLQRVQKLQFSESDFPMIGERDWPTLTILAHELGHHMNNHLTNPLPDATRRGMELEADETAGFLLYLMGGQLEQGKLAFREASETGSYTHPPRDQRHEALARGYTDAAKRFPLNRGGGGTDPVKPDPVLPGRVSFDSVTIGRQVWMSVNLDVDHFLNGDSITEAKTAGQWASASEKMQPVWCYYNFDPSSGPVYGKLYNWYTLIDPRGLSPSGWRVPTDDDWNRLSNHLGGNMISGGALKSISGWSSYKGRNGNGSNDSGFSGLPGGYCDGQGSFKNLGLGGYWWTLTNEGNRNVWNRGIGRIDNKLYRGKSEVNHGLSVRLIKK